MNQKETELVIDAFANIVSVAKNHSITLRVNRIRKDLGLSQRNSDGVVIY